MNREANTLLSKTGGVSGQGERGITELGLAMKAEIEKAREQIQNALLRDHRPRLVRQ